MELGHVLCCGRGPLEICLSLLMRLNDCRLSLPTSPFSCRLTRQLKSEVIFHMLCLQGDSLILRITPNFQAEKIWLKTLVVSYPGFLSSPCSQEAVKALHVRYIPVEEIFKLLIESITERQKAVRQEGLEGF